MCPEKESDNASAGSPQASPARDHFMVQDRYRVRRLLGSGGFATVYEAEDTKLGGRVAVKVLSSDKSFKAKYIARFEQEVQIVRELRHPNTIKVWDVGVTAEGSLYMVMEYLDGHTLAHELRPGTAIPLERALKIAEQVLRSLSEAHQRGVVHRDLKPENIMLTEVEGDPDFVKVLDFGVAKPLAEELSFVKTQTGAVMGTPGYAAPEVLLGERASPASDVYAVGLLLAEMLTGCPVIPIGTVAQMVTSQLALDPKRVSSQIRVDAVARLIRRALERNPKHRYSDASKMLEDLRAVIHQKPWRMSDEIDTAAEALGALAVDQSAAGELADTLEYMPPAGQSTLETPLSEKADAFADQVTRSRPLPGPEPIPEAETDQLRESEKGRGPFSTRWALILVFLLIGAGALVMVLMARQQTPNGSDATPGVPTTAALAIIPEAVPPQETTPEPSPRPRVIPVLPGPTVEQLDWNWLADMGGEPVDAVAVLSRPRSETVTLGEPEQEPQARVLIIQSALINQQAIGMLETALEESRVEPERQSEAQAQLLELNQRLVVQLVEMNRCSTAERRLQLARERAYLMGAGAEERLAALAPEVERCDTGQILPSEPWDGRRFLELVREGTDLYAQAQALPDPEIDRRNSLLSQSTVAHIQAREMLLGMLGDPSLDPERQDQLTEKLWWLDTRIVAIQCAQDRCGAAELQLDEMLAVVDRAPAAEGTGMMGETVEPPTADLPSPAPSERRLTTLALETEIAECRVRTILATGQLDWGALFELLRLSAELYERARLLLEVSRPPIVETVEAPLANQVDVSITSEPEGARLSMGGRLLGNTPYEGSLESLDETVTLTLEREGYLRRRIRIDMHAGQVRQRIRLEAEPPESPFGSIQRLVDE